MDNRSIVIGRLGLLFLYISVMTGGWLDAEHTGVGRWHFRSVAYDYVYSNNWCAAGEYTWTAPTGTWNSEGFANPNIYLAS